MPAKQVTVKKTTRTWKKSSSKPDKYPTIEVSVDSVYPMDCYGRYYYSLYSVEGCNAKEIIKSANDALKRATCKLSYVGTVGDKIEVEVVLERVCTFETHYSYYGETNFIYNFKDEQGNLIIWKTSKYLDIEVGEKITLKGSVKAHSEYKGEPQTVLTRCKVA